MALNLEIFNVEDLVDDSIDTLQSMAAKKGIDSTKLKNVFEKFTQVDSSATRPAEGTGLGLAITKKRGPCSSVISKKRSVIFLKPWKLLQRKIPGLFSWI